MSVRRAEGRAASTTRSGPRPAHCSTDATPMSLVPPRSSTDCGWPSEFSTTLRSQVDGPSELETTGQVGPEQPVRVDLRPDPAEVVQVRVHLRGRLRRGARVLGEVDAATMVDHDVVELTQQRCDAGSGGQVD